MADNKRRGRSGKGQDEDNQSIFDLFEPPPEPAVGSFGRIPIIREDEDEGDESLDLTNIDVAEAAAAAEVEAAGLAHWTEPATGQVPAALATELADSTKELEGPSWRNDDGPWSGPDLSDVFADTDAVTPGRPSGRADLAPPPEAPAPARAPGTRTRPARTPAPAGGPSLFDRPPAGPPPSATPATEQAPPPPAARRTRPTQPAEAEADSRPRTPVGAPEAPAARRAESRPAPGPGRVAGRAPVPEAPARTPAPVRARDDMGRLTEPMARRADSARPATPPPLRPESEDSAASSGGERRLQGIDLGLGGATAAPPAPVADDPRAPAPGPERSPDPGPPVRRRGLADAPPAERSLLGADAPPAPTGSHPGLRVDRRPEPGSELGRGPETPGLGPDDDHDDYDGYDDYDGFYDDEPRDSGGFLSRVLVGVAMAALVFTALGIGAEATMVLIGLLALVAVMELFNAMRSAGLRPATLLGLVGAVALPASTYVRGEAAYPLVVGLAVVFGMLWYLTGADTERPVLNLGLTMTGILWIGGLAGFAALILREEIGVQLLLATILITATSDTLAYLGGRAYGARPFHEASPNKTWEGTLTGFFGAIFAGLVIGVTGVIEVFDDSFLTVMILAVVIGLLAPIGDLAESLVKRDLGIKDMGTILPGHGGILDRVDGLLFALPGAYYVAVVQQLFVT